MGYHERLAAPISWWLVGMVVGVSAGLALGAYLGEVGALVSTLVAVAVVAAVLIAYGHAEIRVDAAGLQAAGAHVEWEYVGEVTPRDAVATRRRLGPEVDPRLYLVVRPFVPASVEVTLVDPEDPHPGWLLSSRHPQDLAAAIEAARRAAGQG